MKLLLVWCCFALLGCVDMPVDPTARYRGPLDPCSVEIDGSAGGWSNPGFDPDHLDPFESAPPRFGSPGPYGAWNTSPAPRCSDDPTIPFVGTERITRKNGSVEEVEHRDVRMYITYPTSSVATVTGDGRVAEGAFPVIIFAHANHDRQCNIYRGYYSLHDHWASWGFVVVALDQTALNCKPGTTQNVQLRADGQVAAVEALRTLNEDPDSRFHGRLDMSKVIFAGHSRGGGASFIAQKAYPAGIGIIDIQGIDTTAFGFGAAPLPAVPVIGFTAGEDVDLNYPHCEPTEDQLGGEYTWVNINGGIHAYTADSSPLEFDDHPLIGRRQQHRITQFYSTAFLARLVGVPMGPELERRKPPAADAVLFTHAGAETALERITPLGVFSRWRSDAAALWVDDFDDADPATNLLGGPNGSTEFDRSDDVATYKPADNPTSGAYAKAYSRLLEGEGSLSLNLAADAAGLDVSSYETLQFRVKGPDEGDVSRLTVSLGETVLPIEDYRGPLELENRMNQVVIPLHAFGVDLADVKAVTFATDDDGAIFIDDVRFSR